MAKARYALKWRVGHPLAKVNGQVLAHRLVLWDNIGPGESTCHWCGCAVRWDVGVKKSKAWARRHPDGVAVLIADHLNKNTFDNSQENIVPACFGCNSNRHKKIQDTDVFKLRGKKQLPCRGEKLNCIVCGNGFVRLNSQKNKTCSYTCGQISHKITLAIRKMAKMMLAA